MHKMRGSFWARCKNFPFVHFFCLTCSVFCGIIWTIKWSDYPLTRVFIYYFLRATGTSRCSER